MLELMDKVERELGTRLIGQDTEMRKYNIDFWIYPPHPGLQTIQWSDGSMSRVEQIEVSKICANGTNLEARPSKHQRRDMGDRQEALLRGVEEWNEMNRMNPILIDFCGTQKQAMKSSKKDTIGGNRIRCNKKCDLRAIALVMGALAMMYIPGVEAIPGWGNPGQTTRHPGSMILDTLGLIIMTWNVARLLFHNKEQIMETLHQWGRPHIVLLQEAMGDHKDEEERAVVSFFEYHGYDLFMTTHPTKRVCRAGILIRKAISNPQMVETINSRMIAIKIKFEIGNLFVMSYYGAPKGSHKQTRDRIRLREKVMRAVDRGMTPIIGGDWNDNWALHELGSGLHEWANQY